MSQFLPRGSETSCHVCTWVEFCVRAVCLSLSLFLSVCLSVCLSVYVLPLFHSPLLALCVCVCVCACACACVCSRAHYVQSEQSSATPTNHRARTSSLSTQICSSW